VGLPGRWAGTGLDVAGRVLCDPGLTTYPRGAAEARDPPKVEADGSNPSGGTWPCSVPGGAPRLQSGCHPGSTPDEASIMPPLWMSTRVSAGACRVS
jgi:hypothetical protein